MTSSANGSGTRGAAAPAPPIILSPNAGAGRGTRLLVTNLVSAALLVGGLVGAIAFRDAKAASEATPDLRRIAFIRARPRPKPRPRVAAKPRPRRSVKRRRQRLRVPHRKVAATLVAPSKVPAFADRPPAEISEDVHLSTSGTLDENQGEIGGGLTPTPPGDVGSGEGPDGPLVPAVVPPKPRTRTKPRTMFLRGDMTRPTRLSGVDPAYSRAARDAGISGLVVVLFTIRPSGDVVNVRLLKSLPVLGDECARAVRRWKFAPVRYQGQPVSLIVKQPFFFKLQD